MKLSLCVINQYFNYKYDRYFKRGQGKVCFALALDLVKDKKLYVISEDR